RLAGPEHGVQVPGHDRHAGIRTDLVVAGLSPTGAQLQGRERPFLFHEGLFLQIPRDRERRERAVAVVRPEPRRSVHAYRSGEGVAVLEGVVGAEQIGEHLPVRRTVEVRLARGRTRVTIPQTRVLTRDVGARAAEYFVVERLRGDAGEQVQALALRLIGVSERVLPQPGAAGARLHVDVGDVVLLKGRDGVHGHEAPEMRATEVHAEAGAERETVGEIQLAEEVADQALLVFGAARIENGDRRMFRRTAQCPIGRRTVRIARQYRRNRCT